MFGSFLKKEGEEFGGVSTISNSSFLISPNWRDLEGEVWDIVFNTNSFFFFFGERILIVFDNSIVEEEKI